MMTFKYFLTEENALFEEKMQKVQDDIYSGMTGPFKRHHKKATASSLEDFAKLAAQGHSIIEYKDRNYSVDGSIHQLDKKSMYPGFYILYISSAGVIRIVYAHNPKTDKMQLLRIKKFGADQEDINFDPPPLEIKKDDNDNIAVANILKVFDSERLYSGSNLNRTLGKIKAAEKKGVKGLEQIKEKVNKVILQSIENHKRWLINPPYPNVCDPAGSQLNYLENLSKNLEVWKKYKVDLPKEDYEFADKMYSDKKFMLKLILSSYRANISSRYGNSHRIKIDIREIRKRGNNWPELEAIEKSMNHKPQDE